MCLPDLHPLLEYTEGVFSRQRSTHTYVHIILYIVCIVRTRYVRTYVDSSGTYIHVHNSTFMKICESNLMILYVLYIHMLHVSKRSRYMCVGVYCISLSVCVSYVV